MLKFKVSKKKNNLKILLQTNFEIKYHFKNYFSNKIYNDIKMSFEEKFQNVIFQD